MTPFQAIILGIIQGITEFLPISSSGHLVLAPHLLGWNLPDSDMFAFDVLAQVATLGAVIGYFWHDVREITWAVVTGLGRGRPFEQPAARLGWLLALATIPAGAAYLLFNDTFERSFSNPLSTALFLLVTAALLTLAEKFHKPERQFSDINWRDALTIGTFQILALFPGVSRSGATIAGGMSRHLERKTAARFSFLISLPLMLAAGLIGIIKLVQIPDFGHLLPAFSAGFLAAGLVGYLAVRWLMKYLNGRSLYAFAWYCVAFSLLNLSIFAFRG